MSTDAVTSSIGTSAGAIWETLACNGPVALDWLCRVAKLDESDANRGIGWLAREGKLSLERRARRRELRVAEAAEQIRRILHSRGPMLLVRAAQMTALPEDLAQQGLGWLAREGRAALRRTADGRAVELGKAAGKVWRLVRARGTVARKDVPRATGLTEGLANEAIGWLVREGKLVVEDRRAPRSTAAGPAGPGSSLPGTDPGLPPSQMEEPTQPQESQPPDSGGMLTLEKKGEGRGVPIGEAAGSIWRALQLQGHLSAEELSRETGLAEGLLNQGIGWLAREGKLAIARDRKGHEWFRLNEA